MDSLAPRVSSNARRFTGSGSTAAARRNNSGDTSLARIVSRLVRDSSGSQVAGSRGSLSLTRTSIRSARTEVRIGLYGLGTAALPVFNSSESLIPATAASSPAAATAGSPGTYLTRGATNCDTVASRTSSARRNASTKRATVRCDRHPSSGWIRPNDSLAYGRVPANSVSGLPVVTRPPRDGAGSVCTFAVVPPALTANGSTVHGRPDPVAPTRNSSRADWAAGATKEIVWVLPGELMTLPAYSRLPAASRSRNAPLNAAMSGYRRGSWTSMSEGSASAIRWPALKSLGCEACTV